MVAPSKFKVADYDGEVPDIQDTNGKSLYKPVTITWSKPKEWLSAKKAPITGVEESNGYIYAVMRNHHKQTSRDQIAYIGITTGIKTRFYNHKKARDLAEKPGLTQLSVGIVDFGSYRSAVKNIKPALEEIEHILIWAIWPYENERKNYTVPGLGKNGGRAWHIFNKRYRFSGQMPQELVYPWMIVKPGRDRSWKTK